MLKIDISEWIQRIETHYLYKFNSNYNMFPKGYLRIIMGPMYSGKSTLLVDLIKKESSSKNHNRFDEKFSHSKRSCSKLMIINHASDTRYGRNVLSTHSKQQVPCYSFSTLTIIDKIPEYQKVYSEANKIIIDESQFFDPTNLYNFVYKSVFTFKKTVIVSGLSGDSNQQKFGGLLDLIPLADKIDVLYATCQHCGEPAPFTKRIVNDDRVTLVGSTGMYEPVCREHL